jgi:nitrogen regulatory protein PII-like uncharacterized protein
MVHEKRKSRRSDIFHVIEINSHTTLLGLITNFSYRGLCIEMDNIEFEQKENIEFTLKHLQSNSSVSFIGDVVWEKCVANTFLAGIKLRPMEKAIKEKLIEILYAIRDTPVDLFNFGRKSEILMNERKEEKSVAILSENVVPETSEIHKRKLMPHFIIGLSISSLILVGSITFKALRMPVSTINHETTPKELDPKKHLIKSENVLTEPLKEQAGSRILDVDALSHKANEAQHIDMKRVIQVRSDNNIDTEHTLNEKLNADDQHASGFVYTIQIKSLSKIADAQKQFNFMLLSLNKENLNLLRIEKVEEFYTLRLGKFDKYKSAKKFLHDMRPRLSEAVILKAHIKNERIMKLYE